MGSKNKFQKPSKNNVNNESKQKRAQHMLITIVLSMLSLYLAKVASVPQLLISALTSVSSCAHDAPRFGTKEIACFCNFVQICLECNQNCNSHKPGHSHLAAGVMVI
jgi:hypothetical protein